MLLKENRLKKSFKLDKFQKVITWHFVLSAMIVVSGKMYKYNNTFKLFCLQLSSIKSIKLKCNADYNLFDYSVIHYVIYVLQK